MSDKRKILIAVLIVLMIAIPIGTSIYQKKISKNAHQVTVSKIDNMITGTWQAEVKFPDWKGYIDDTLAMNSMYSFDGFKDQSGKEYESTHPIVKSKKAIDDVASRK